MGELVFKADMVGKAEEISAVIDDDSGKIAVEVKQTHWNNFDIFDNLKHCADKRKVLGTYQAI